MPVEPATLEDLERVVELWVALAIEQRDYGSHLTAESNRDLMREALAQHVVDHTCLVARGEPDGATPDIVGFVSFNLERDGLDRDASRGVVQNLYVAPEARNEGVGGKLLAAAEDALVGAGAERVVLQAMAANEAGRRFYEERGYDPHRVTYERSTADGKDSKEGN